ncbi:hypothetical protein V1478_012382 [Vespula squamosa]|uniref:Uncharacterized protein n=1 Tax=Vespula squamosa TaxID=30214 RepID=A0ABD2ADM0_VESSQ
MALAEKRFALRRRDLKSSQSYAKVDTRMLLETSQNLESNTFVWSLSYWLRDTSRVVILNSIG